MNPNNTQTPSIVVMIEQKTFALFLPWTALVKHYILLLGSMLKPVWCSVLLKVSIKTC